MNEKAIQKKPGNKKTILVGGLVFILLLAVLGTVYFLTRPQPAPAGAKAYTVAVVDKEGKSTGYSGTTDSDYVGQALRELMEQTDFAMEGRESEFGFFIEAVNGITADYDTDGAYWAFYLNGEYAQNGIDSQPIQDGDEIALRYES